MFGQRDHAREFDSVEGAGGEIQNESAAVEDEAEVAGEEGCRDGGGQGAGGGGIYAVDGEAIAGEDGGKAAELEEIDEASLVHGGAESGDGPDGVDFADEDIPAAERGLVGGGAGRIHLQKDGAALDEGDEGAGRGDGELGERLGDGGGFGAVQAKAVAAGPIAQGDPEAVVGPALDVGPEHGAGGEENGQEGEEGVEGEGRGHFWILYVSGLCGKARMEDGNFGAGR